MRLCNLLCFCQGNITAYRLILGDKKIDVQNIDRVWKNIPITYKSDIIKNVRSYVSIDISDELLNDIVLSQKSIMNEKLYLSSNGVEKYYVEYTTGSTGYPLMSIKSENERLALGMNLWKLRNTIEKVSPKQMFGFIHNSFGERLQKENGMIEVLKYLETKKYNWWHINQEKIANISRFVKDGNRNINSLRVIENNGSYMSLEEKEEYEELFGCKIVDNYGCREVWTIAYTCVSNHLHVNSDNILFELYDDNDDIVTDYNREGRVVVTSIIQKTMPFIKYDTGDRAVYLNETCRYCASPIIKLKPNRTFIKGQKNIEGNKVFRNVLKKMNYRYGVYNYESIKVVQISTNKFVVFITGNAQEKNIIETAFIKSVREHFETENLKFEFVYNYETSYKNLFQVDLTFESKKLNIL